MKTISTALQDHLAQAVTTLAICWLIVRRDGMSYAFTTLDVDLVIDDVTYSSVVGFSRSAISSGATAQVDNLETVGFFSAAGIAEEDIKKGLFNYALVQLFFVNWADLSMGTCKLRQGWLGEVNFNTNSDGSFMTELRGLTQALVQESGNFFTPICRADLGDAQCTVPIKPAGWLANQRYAPGAFIQAQTQNTDALLIAMFEADYDGTTGATEPAWNTTIGATTTDGTLTWTCRPPFRGLASVSSTISQHAFVSGALAIPGAAQVNLNTAVIAFSNNVSAFTTLTVSDGIHEIGFTAPYDMKGVDNRHPTTDALHNVYNGLVASSLEMTFVLQPTAILITNNSGVPGSITKTGDYLGGIEIEPFGTAVLDGGAITWISGENIGLTMELKTYTAGSSTVELWLAMPYPISIGDRFLYYPGCDKNRNTCYSTFNNINNFRGEPDMRGMDVFLSYPDV
jgi:hypothetical protein